MTTVAKGERKRRRIRVRHILGAWAIFVALFLLWQLFAYRGLMALAAEWEFNTFGRYYPALTYVLIVVLLASPILWLLRPRRRRVVVEGEEMVVERPIVGLPGLAFIRVILGVAIGCAVASLIALIGMIMQPDDQGVAARITIGSAAAGTPAEGPTVLVGDVVGERVAGLSEDLILARRSFRYAPMLSPGGRAEPVRFFVEVGDANTLATARQDGSLTGILKRDALPGELVRLFRYAGFDVAVPHYVLFASRDSIQWPFRVVAGELALAALICALVTLGLHVRRERIRQGDDEHPGKSLPVS
jgi:hypothetical protein